MLITDYNAQNLKTHWHLRAVAVGLCVKLRTMNWSRYYKKLELESQRHKESLVTYALETVWNRSPTSMLMDSYIRIVSL